MIGLIIWALVIFSADMVNKTNPNVVVSDVIEDQLTLDVGPDTFNFGVIMGNPYKSQ